MGQGMDTADQFHEENHSADEARDSIKKLATRFLRVWSDTTVAVARATFGYIDLANPPAKIKESQKKSIDFLYNQINLDPRFPFPDVEDSKRYILKVAQGFLIPRAWIMAHTGNVQHKQGFKPVILETGTRCDQPHPPSPSEAGGLLWEHVDRNQVQVCLDGQRFYVVSAVGDFYAGEGVAIPMFEKLPGWDTLQGGSSANSEVYISQEDVVRSALATRTKFGKNLAGVNTKNLEDDGTKHVVYDAGVRAPGVAPIPICGMNEVVKQENWDNEGANGPRSGT